MIEPEEDPLAAARGIVNGAVLGLLAWAVIALLASLVIGAPPS